MPILQFTNETSGAVELRDTALPVDVTTLGLPAGSYSLRGVTAPAPAPVVIAAPPVAGTPFIGYDFLSATPTVNQGSGGAAYDMIHATAGLDQTNGLQVRDNQAFESDTQYALPLGTSFTFHLRLLFTNYSFTGGLNLLSTTFVNGTDTNGEWANYMDDNILWFFPDNGGGTAASIGFTPQNNVVYDIAVTYDWATRLYQVYWDGVLRTSYTRGADYSYAPAQTMNICQYKGLPDRNPDANVQRFNFYNSVLTAQEIQAL